MNARVPSGQPAYPEDPHSSRPVEGLMVMKKTFPPRSVVDCGSEPFTPGSSSATR
jgi:hypothetical protein